MVQQTGIESRVGGRAPPWYAISQYDWLDWALFVQMILAAGINGFQYYLLGSKQIYLYPALAINLAFLAIGLLYIQKGALYSLGFLIFIVFSVVVFATKYDAPLDFAQVGSYASIMSASLFACHAMKHSLDRGLRILFYSSVIYTLTYLYFRATIDPYQVAETMHHSKGVFTGYLMTHGSQTGDSDLAFRIYASDFNFAVGLLYCMVRSRTNEKNRIGWMIGALIFMTCFIVSDFRFALFCMTLTVILSLLPIGTRTKVYGVTGATLIYMAVSLTLATLGINQYDPVKNDVTGSVRWLEAELSIGAYQDNLLFGTGIAGQAEDMSRVFGPNLVAPSDLGFLGMIYRFGAFGFFLLIILNLMMAKFALQSQWQKDISRESKFIILGLFLYVMFTQSLSTYLLDGGGGVFLAIVFAYRLSPITRKYDGRVQGRPSNRRSNAERFPGLTR